MKLVLVEFSSFSCSIISQRQVVSSAVCSHTPLMYIFSCEDKIMFHVRLG